MLSAYLAAKHHGTCLKAGSPAEKKDKKKDRILNTEINTLERMYSLKKIIIGSLFALGLTLVPHGVFAEETAAEKVQEVGQDAAKQTKKAYRATKDAVCMKSDTKCLAQKAKHKMQNAGDEIEDKADDVKKKVD